MSEENWEDLTEKQQRILRTAAENPELTNKEIADEAGSSSSYVSQVRNDYEDEVEIKGSRQSSPGLLEFLIVGPIKLTLWLIAVSLKLTPSDQRGESDT
jgi:hypothetical protein